MGVGGFFFFCVLERRGGVDITGAGERHHRTVRIPREEYREKCSPEGYLRVLIEMTRSVRRGQGDLPMSMRQSKWAKPERTGHLRSWEQDWDVVVVDISCGQKRPRGLKTKTGAYAIPS